MVLAYKGDESWAATNVWLVKYRVKVRGKLEEREKYVTGVSQCHNDGEINMEPALAVAAVYGGKRIRILSTRFVGTGAMSGHDYKLQVEHWKRQRVQPPCSMEEGRKR